MRQTVMAFIDRINAHDVEGIMALMAPDYVFVDSAGDSFTGHDYMRKNWQTYFDYQREYRIDAQTVVAGSEGVGIFGFAEGIYCPDGVVRAENRWRVPAAFLLKAKGGL